MIVQQYSSINIDIIVDLSFGTVAPSPVVVAVVVLCHGKAIDAVVTRGGMHETLRNFVTPRNYC